MMTLEDLKRRFQYTPDGFDNWRVMDEPTGPLRGDCDDWAWTAAYICSRCSMPRLFVNVFTGRIQMWLCRTDAGERHMMLKHEGLYIDNISPRWSEVPMHDKLFLYWGPLALAKAAISKIVRAVGGAR